jgi:hypothetical protein
MKIIIERTTHGKTEALYKELSSMNLQLFRTNTSIIVCIRNEHEKSRVEQMCDQYGFICCLEPNKEINLEKPIL